MKYEYHSKFKIGDKVYYIGSELKQIFIVPCTIDTVCFTSSGVKYFVDNIGDEVLESEIVNREDVQEIIARIEYLSEELC